MYIHSGRGRRQGFGRKHSGAGEHGFKHVRKCERPGRHAPALFGAAGSPFPFQDPAPGTGELRLLQPSGKRAESFHAELEQARTGFPPVYHLH